MGATTHDLLRFATAGSVDDGKSTLVGRLLHDTKSVLIDTLASVERASRAKGLEAADLALLTVNLASDDVLDETEMREALDRLQGFKERVRRASVQGGRAFNPGWHLALDLKNMLLVAEAVAKSALERTESRGGHTRDDYPTMSADWRQINIVCKAVPDGVEIYRQPIAPMREDLLELFDVHELEKYMTEAELPKGEHS